MKRSALRGLVLGAVVAATACGGSGEHTPEEVARATTALTCSPEGTYLVDVVGTAQAIDPSTYECSGVHPTQKTVTLQILPGAAAGEWLVTFGGLSGKQWTITETNGIIDWSLFAAGAGPEKVWIGCGYSGSLKLRVDDTSVYVYRYCHFMSGTSGCDRYTRVAGTLARSCAPPSDPDAGESDAGAEPDASPDASSEPDASTDFDVSEPDAQAPADRSVDPPEGASSTPEPNAGPSPSPSVIRSCSANGAPSPGASAPIAIAIALGLALARRRRVRARA